MSHLIGGGSNWGKFDMAQITVKTLEVLYGPDVAASDDGGEGDPDRQALYKQPPTQPNPSGGQAWLRAGRRNNPPRHLHLAWASEVRFQALIDADPTRFINGTCRKNSPLRQPLLKKRCSTPPF